MKETNKLKKDPPMMRSDIPVDRDAWLRDLTAEELRDLYRKMIERDVDIDQHPEKEEEYETYGADWEKEKIAIDKEFKRRGISFEE